VDRKKETDMTVLIVADEADFARDIVNRWSTERSAPAFAVIGSTVLTDSDASFDLAIVSPHAARLDVLQALSVRGEALLCVTTDASAAHDVRERCPRALVLHQHEGWLDALVLTGCEILRRIEANRRAAHAEEALATASRHATLGQYMLDMRHSMNNALTSVLGHAELILLEPGALPAEMREQIETIHSMALRIHEILQRFSSIDTELQCTEKKTGIKAHAAVI
jgi:signal transduction histidine kinase